MTVGLQRALAAACPVGIKAKRQSSSQQEWVISLEDTLHPQRPGTRVNSAGVHVEVLGFDGKEIKQAEVAVYYMAPGVHSMLVDSMPGYAAHSAFDLKKTFILSATAGESTVHLAQSLRVDNAATITRVRLLRIEYADGSTWQTPDTTNCGVTPRLLMAVASH